MKNNQKRIKNNTLNLSWAKLLTLTSTVLLAYTVPLTPAFSQQIITNGYTNTQLTISNRKTNVTTSTIKGLNAFNSFSKFNVDSGNVVNLQVPSGCQNLINLVRTETSNINGILNSIQAGKVGGNIFLVNPYGITVGTQGVINTGSLTAITPSQDFVNNFFDAPGNPNSASIDTLINGQVERNNSAQFINNGIINAIERVKIDSTEVINSGNIYTGAVFKENDIETGDIVNLNTLESGSDLIVQNRQTVIISANNFINNGTIVADGADNTDAGIINITTTNDITLNPDSIISAKGKGTDSRGGNIYIFADNNAYFKEDAVIDASGGNISGDGGTIELSSEKQVLVSGNFYASANKGKAGNVIIDPIDLLINTNQILPGTNIFWDASNSVTVDGATISTRVIDGSTDYSNALSTGDSGYLIITAPNITITNDSKIYTHANNGFDGQFVFLDADNTSISGVENANATLEINNSTIKTIDFTVSVEAGEASSLDIAGANGFILLDNATIIADNNIIIFSSGGAASGTNESYATSEIYTDNTSLIAGENISFRSMSGAAVSTHDVYSGAIISSENSILNAGQDIFLSSIATTAHGEENTNIETITRTLLSTLTADRDITFTTQSGFMLEASTNEAIAEAASYSVASTIEAGRDIIYTSTGGNAIGDNYASSGANSFIQMSEIETGRDIIFEAVGGEGTSLIEAEAYAQSFIDINSNVLAPREILLKATGGTATSNIEAYGDSWIVISTSDLMTYDTANLISTGGTANGASGFVDATANVLILEAVINSIGDIFVEATATQLGHDAKIEIDADSTLFAGDFIRELIINEDGSIDNISSNIYAEKTDSSITVGNVVGGEIVLIANRADGLGEIYGAGELNIYNGFQSVDITNNSNLDLIINDINNALSGQITKSGDYTGTFTEIINTDNSPKEININNNGTSNLTFGGQVNNPTGAIKTNTSNNITINSGANINSGIINNAIVLNSAEGHFINNSGSNALSADNGRWLIYADNPFDSVEGGLDANRQYNVDYAIMPPDTFTKPGNYFLYSYAPTLTLTADNKSRTYGSDNPEFTYTVSGLIAGDILSEALDGYALFATTATKSSNVGIYSINIAQDSLVSDMGYEFNFANGTLTLNKANLTITADNKTKVFGENNPSFTASYSGFVLGQNLLVLDGNLIFITDATKDSFPGTYDIILSGLFSDNYNITFSPGELTVTPGGNQVNGIFETIVGINTNLVLTNFIPSYYNNYLAYRLTPFSNGEAQNNDPESLIDTSALTNQ